MKKCNRCRKLKEETSFNLFRGRLNKGCKECRERLKNYYDTDIDGSRTKRKEYYEHNKEEISAKRSVSRLKRKYSLDKETFEKMLNLQNNKCPLCDKSFDELTPCVDHNHETGKVRGLLCRKCNLTLHYIEYGFIKKALEYLQVNEVRDKELSR